MALKSQGMWEFDIPLARGLAHGTQPRCSVPALLHHLLLEECNRRKLSASAVITEAAALKDDTENDAGAGSTG